VLLKFLGLVVRVQVYLTIKEPLFHQVRNAAIGLELLQLPDCLRKGDYNFIDISSFFCLFVRRVMQKLLYRFSQ